MVDFEDYVGMIAYVRRLGSTAEKQGDNGDEAGHAATPAGFSQSPGVVIVATENEPCQQLRAFENES